MVPGVYIGKSNTGDYDLLSTGDFINPISSTFKLKDSKTSLIKDIPLYLIINDIDIDTVKISVTGRVTAIRQFLSWDSNAWRDNILLNETINAIGAVVIRPFVTRIIVDDFLEYFNISQESSFKQYKLKLMFT